MRQGVAFGNPRSVRNSARRTSTRGHSTDLSDPSWRRPRQRSWCVGEPALPVEQLAVRLCHSEGKVIEGTERTHRFC